MAGSGAPFGVLHGKLEELSRRATSAERILDRRALGTAGDPAAVDATAEKLPPGMYMRLAGGKELGELSPEEQSLWRNSPGGRAILKWAEMKLGSDEMVRAFHEAFRAVRWHWDAFAGEGDASAHLDGYQKTGQCGSLVKAFIKLVSVAPPYGMGITEGLAVAGYAGQAEGKEYGFGFLAEHPRGLSGLYSNIGPLSSKEAEGYGVNGFPPVHGFYLWEQHKVVSYGAGNVKKYLDPSYGRTYTSLSQMARYEVQGEPQLKNGEPPAPGKPGYVPVLVGGATVYFRDNVTALPRYTGPYREIP